MRGSRYPPPVENLAGRSATNWDWFDPVHAHRIFWPDRPDGGPPGSELSETLPTLCGTTRAGGYLSAPSRAQLHRRRVPRFRGLRRAGFSGAVSQDAVLPARPIQITQWVPTSRKCIAGEQHLVSDGAVADAERLPLLHGMPTLTAERQLIDGLFGASSCGASISSRWH